MTSLGFWQLDRMEQKQQRLASITQKQAQGPVDFSQVINMPDPRDIDVTVSGIPDTSAIMLLDNQIHQGKPGYDVLIPVQTDFGWLLVNYGWVAAPRYRDELPDLDVASEVQRFKGVITRPGDNPMIRETATEASHFPLVIQKPDTDTLGELLNRQFRPHILELTTPDAQYVREWEPVVMSPEKHLGYAIQWFGLALAGAVIGAVAIFRKGNNHAR
ncbi:SURF1 family protein [Alteromonas halophila]|uniref:SURF1-like protein n=1 Tax=Alteromonas halophila TaxID=516698 RepID=A0A918JMY6_9ALTE|nr:hypothetical protein GCM10007391_26840 [Alteromonas halophila]